MNKRNQLNMTERKRIVLVLPRGEAIKNFVFSGTSMELRKSAYVVIISVIPNKEIEELIRINSDEYYELKQTSIPYLIGVFANWLDIVHGRWLWSLAAKWRGQ